MEVNLELNPEAKIKDIMPKLKNELAGIFNKVIAAGIRMKERGEFTLIPEQGELLNELVDDSSPVHSFWNEFCVKSEGDTVSINDLFECFQSELEFAKESYKMSRRGFEKKLKPILKEEGLSLDKIMVEGRWRKGINNVCLIQENDGDY